MPKMFLITKHSTMCRRHKLSITQDKARSMGTLNGSPLPLTKACRRYATMDKNKLGDFTIRKIPKPLKARLSETYS